MTYLVLDFLSCGDSVADGEGARVDKADAEDVQGTREKGKSHMSPAYADSIVSRR